MAAETSVCEPESMEATDPLFILYTSGSTAKPKGIVHGNGGYLLYAAVTSKYVFDLKESDVFWCTADVAGSPGIRIWCTARSPTARRRSCSKGCPPTPSPTATGRWWRSSA